MSSPGKSYVIGVDYGTDSVRAILVDAQQGEEIAADVFYYPRWKKGLYCNVNENQFRQHPLDYIEGLEQTIQRCLKKAGAEIAAQVKAISVDTTGSSPVAVDRTGTPLALLPEFADNPDAMFVLWKDHTAVNEAAEINAHATKFETNYLRYVGGIYSSEWFWAKLLHVLRSNAALRPAVYSFVEHCDWIPFLLTGGTDVHAMKRSVCAAGHKILWAEEWGGLPPDAFFASLDPLLGGFTARLFKDTATSDTSAGTISKEWAKRLGLPEDVQVGVGAYDAHMGAVGGQIEPYHLSKVMGTSTCDIMVAPLHEVEGKLIGGICGQVNGSVIPGMLGLEAGQSSFGDAYAWFKKIVAWPLQHILAGNEAIDAVAREELIKATEDNIIPALSKLAALVEVTESSELALDWFNGRRTPDANQLLTASIEGLNLGSDAPRLFRAIVEATCFGAKAIADRFNDQGIPVQGLIGMGGVARKSPFIMQMMADVMNMPIRIHRSEQTCAMGAAMFAATVAGVYAKVEDAMHVMGQGFDAVYTPDETKVAVYAQRYERYKATGNFVASLVGETEAATSAINKQASNKYRYLQEEVYEANMQLPAAGLVVMTFGNASAADRAQGAFAIKPSGVPYDQLSPDKMVIVDFEGKTVQGLLRPSSDTLTHAVLYKHWEKINGIVHTHSTYATAWAQSLRDIPIFGTTHADHLITNVPCAAPMSDELIKGDYEYETGFQIMQCFSERGFSYEEVEMILVGNHAPFTWGKTVAKAVSNSAVLEQVAHMALLTEQINAAAPLLKDSLIKKHFERKHGPMSYYGQV